MASLNLLVGYGSDDSEASSEATEILSQQETLGRTTGGNFFQADDSSNDSSSNNG